MNPGELGPTPALQESWVQNQGCRVPERCLGCGLLSAWGGLLAVLRCKLRVL